VLVSFLLFFFLFSFFLSLKKWLFFWGLTAEFDPEIAECFVTESASLGDWCEDLAILEDGFSADSEVVCSINISACSRESHKISQTERYLQERPQCRKIVCSLDIDIFGVCSASVLTGHGPSHELCWLQHAKHSLSKRWWCLRRHNDGDMFNSV
jgi:hypothetical protein